MRWGHGSRLRMCALTRWVGIPRISDVLSPGRVSAPDAMFRASRAARSGRHCPRRRVGAGVQRLPPVSRIAVSRCVPAARRAASRSYRLPIRCRAPSPSDDQDAGGGQQQPADARPSTGPRGCSRGRADRVGRPGQLLDQRAGFGARTTSPSGSRRPAPQNDDARHRPIRRTTPRVASAAPNPASADQRQRDQLGDASRRRSPRWSRPGQRVEVVGRPPGQTAAATAASAAPATARIATSTQLPAAAAALDSRPLGALAGRLSHRPAAAWPRPRPRRSPRPPCPGTRRPRSPAPSRPPPRRRPARRRCRRRPARCGW